MPKSRPVLDTPPRIAGAGGAGETDVSSVVEAATEPKTQTSWLEENLLLFLTVTAVILGFVIGLVARMLTPSSEAIFAISFPGEIFMNMLKMLILPLITSSMVSGLAQMDPKTSGKMGTRALVYYLVTTALSAGLGLAIVLLVHPGDPSLKDPFDVPKPPHGPRHAHTLDTILDLIRNMFPENLIQACTSRAETEYENVTKFDPQTGRTSYLTQRTVVYKPGSNILGIIVFFITFGVIVAQMGHRADTMIKFFVQLNEILMRMVFIVMWFSPAGIMSLIIGKLLSIDDLGTTATQLGLYTTTVLVALLIHVGITLPLVYFLLTRSNPYVFIRGMLQAIITALSTSSSQATLPVSIQCLEENLKIDPRVARFMMPIGATVNMDGTALYEAIASIFIAQVNNISLGVVDLLTVSLMATIASIGAAAIPSGGLVTMLLVLTAVGLPTEDISMIVTVDWILDRVRTAVNIMGDAFGAGIVAHFGKAEMAKPMQTARRPLRRESVKVVNETGGSASESELTSVASADST